MSKLVDELKKEHSKIIEKFVQVDKESGAENRNKLILELKEITVFHLEKEDKELYPVLLNSKDKDTSKLGETFSDLMKGYAEKFLAMIDVVQAFDGEKLTPELLSTYQNVRDKIMHRVELEEAVLYPAYENIIKNN